MYIFLYVMSAVVFYMSDKQEVEEGMKLLGRSRTITRGGLGATPRWCMDPGRSPRSRRWRWERSDLTDGVSEPFLYLSSHQTEHFLRLQL